MGESLECNSFLLILSKCYLVALHQRKCLLYSQASFKLNSIMSFYENDLLCVISLSLSLEIERERITLEGGWWSLRVLYPFTLLNVENEGKIINYFSYILQNIRKFIVLLLGISFEHSILRFKFILIYVPQHCRFIIN